MIICVVLDSGRAKMMIVVRPAPAFENAGARQSAGVGAQRKDLPAALPPGTAGIARRDRTMLR
jgi:hypothetical protein